MSYLTSLPEDATLFELMRRFPGLAKRLVPINSYVMRGPSPLTAAQRETIAAYVSALNACEYCIGSHTEAAKAFGVPEGTLTALVADIDQADIEDRFKPILHYVRKLTLTPSSMTEADADAVYAGGWDEEALFSAVLVCCTFNYMNRLTDGVGLAASTQQAVGSGKLLREKGYEVILKMLDLE